MPRQEPDRQRAGVGVRLVEVVRELLDGVRQPALRIDVELLVLVPYRAASSRMCAASSKLRPANEIDNVFSRVGDAAAA